MSTYLKLRVKEVIKETEDSVSLVFDNQLKYKPGQFLTLLLNVKGEKIRRSYSLCTAQGVDEFPAITIKRVVNGKASNYLADTIKRGDEIEVMEPLGTFTITTDKSLQRSVVLIGAGSGVTPLMGIARAILNTEPSSKVCLIYGNRNENTIIFKEKLVGMERDFASRFQVKHVLSQPSSAWTSHKGRLSQSVIIKLIEEFSGDQYQKNEYFICGPDGMMQEAQNALNVLQIPTEKIRRESFASTTNTADSGIVVDADATSVQQVTVIYAGTEYKFEVPPAKTILEAALDQDIDLPYSCQSGVCTACMGKCKTGKVHLDNPDGLSDKEIEQGYVLTCVGHPVSANVVIEID